MNNLSDLGGLMRRVAGLGAIALGCLLPLTSPAMALPARQPYRTSLPAGSYVQRGFEPPAQRWLAGHRGVDLAAAPGEPVIAPASGVITFAGSIAGTGVVSVVHPGMLHSTYQPIAPAVKAGDSVLPGSVLGFVTVGSHCFPAACLHWGAIKNGSYINPLLAFHVFPRLLPL